MRSSFGARRQARKVGQEDDEETTDSYPELERQEQDPPATVIRPPITSRGSSRSKKRATARVSFGPGGTSMTEDDDSGENAVFTPKKSSLSRQAIEKNALRKSIANNLSSEHLPFRQTEDRPSYSADHLNELKTSTPSTPKDLRSQSDVNNENGQALDLVSKFGSDLAFQDSASLIPTDAEIREKKERRARLAKEQDFISLDDDDAQDQEDSDGERSLLPYAKQKSSKKKEETRLVRDDEDIAEGFDEFVSDGRIALGRKAEREQKKQQEAAMREMINEAEGGGKDSADSEDDDDDSEAERHAAYEAAQTRKGMDGLRRDDQSTRPKRPRTPPRITPLPTLAGCLEKLRQKLAGMEYTRMQKVKRLEEIRKEKADIKIREEEIQQLLKETGERYEKLRQEAEKDRPPDDGLGPGGGLGSAAGGMVAAVRAEADNAGLLKMAWER